MDRLKLCPFCGAVASDIGVYVVCDGSDWFVECFACLARGGADTTEANAIAAWNKRAEQAQEGNDAIE